MPWVPLWQPSTLTHVFTPRLQRVRIQAIALYGSRTHTHTNTHKHTHTQNTKTSTNIHTTHMHPHAQAALPKRSQQPAPPPAHKASSPAATAAKHAAAGTLPPSRPAATAYPSARGMSLAVEAVSNEALVDLLQAVACARPCLDLHQAQAQAQAQQLQPQQPQQQQEQQRQSQQQQQQQQQGAEEVLLLRNLLGSLAQEAEARGGAAAATAAAPSAATAHAHAHTRAPRPTPSGVPSLRVSLLRGPLALCPSQAPQRPPAATSPLTTQQLSAVLWAVAALQLTPPIVWTHSVLSRLARDLPTAPLPAVTFVLRALCDGLGDRLRVSPGKRLAGAQCCMWRVGKGGIQDGGQGLCVG